MDSDDLIADDNGTSALSWKSVDCVGDLELIRVDFYYAVRKGETVLAEFQSGMLLVYRLVILFILRITIYL